MTYFAQAVLWIVALALAGLAARPLIDWLERRARE